MPSNTTFVAGGGDPDPRVSGLSDISGDRIVDVEEAENPVNRITFVAGAAGVSPSIKATGVDTNIDVVVEPKGSGQIKNAAGQPIQNTMAVTTSITNQTGGTLDPGMAVALKANTDGSLGVILADNTTNIQATHFVKTSIVDTAVGTVYLITDVSGLDTSTATDVGYPVYLGTAGGRVFNTAPTGASVIGQLIGTVLVKGVNGTIQFYSPTLTLVGKDNIQGEAIVNSKISTAAGIAFSKMEVLNPGEMIVANGAGVPTALALAGDVQVGDTGTALVSRLITNKTGNLLGKGALVHLKVNADMSEGVTVADSATGVEAQYVVGSDIANDASGYVYKNLTVSNLNTAGASGVDAVAYLTAAGAWTFTPPATAADLVQPVGRVEVKDGAVGKIHFNIGEVTKRGTAGLQPASVTATELGASFPFAGTPDTISPTAALDGAPTFSGTPDTISPTAELATTPVFTGDALGAHSHSVSVQVIMRLSTVLQDILGSLNASSENVDSAAAPTNDQAISIKSAVAAGAWTVGALTNPDVPRNVGIVIKNGTGGSLDLFEGVMTFTVAGTDQFGAAQSELVTITSSAINKSVGNAPDWRYKYGSKIFKTVSNITLDNVPADGLEISACPGSLIGILNPLSPALESAMIRTSVNATNYSFTGKVNATLMSVDMGTLSDGDDVVMMYASSASQAATSSSDSAGTPSGLVDKPAVTVNGAAYTPAGTNSTPTITVTGAAYTPAGTITPA